MDEHKDLKDALTTTYEKDIKSGKAIDQLWGEYTKDGKTDQQVVLGEFYTSAKTFQQALNIQNPGEIQDVIQHSPHNVDFQSYYEKSIVSGDRYKELLKDNPFESATATFSLEAGLYSVTLDPKFVDSFGTKLQDNFTDIAQDNSLKNFKLDDLMTAFGAAGGDRLDEAKLKNTIETIQKDNPALLVNEKGNQIPADKIIMAVRGLIDTFRQTLKTKNVLSISELKIYQKKILDRGILHGTSGIFLAATTIAKGVQSGAHPTDKNIVDITTGSIAATDLITEGGVKAYKTYLDKAGEGGGKFGKMSDDKFKELQDKWSRVGDTAAGFGATAGIVTGAYSIFDGVRSLRNGDKLTGGINITTGSIGAISGAASLAEAGFGALAPSVMEALPIAGTAGVLGVVSAGAAVLGLLIPMMVEESKNQHLSDQFGDLLGSYLEKYGIDGVPNGTFRDLPDSAWPPDDGVPS